jgi:hypothetical protein
MLQPRHSSKFTVVEGYRPETLITMELDRSEAESTGRMEGYYVVRMPVRECGAILKEKVIASFEAANEATTASS